MPRRIHRHDPAPWAHGGWRDAPGALPASGPMPTGAPLPADLRSFQVGVFPRRRGGYEAYTRDYCADWKGCCVHGVSAINGKAAKVLAVEEHLGQCVRA